MTRINLVPPSELFEQHLLAEFRELTRIPNCVLRGRYNFRGFPKEYTLGTGHVKFFYNKLALLKTRYDSLRQECIARGFNVKAIFPSLEALNPSFLGDYTPTAQAIALNRERIAKRLATMKPRYTGKDTTQ